MDQILSLSPSSLITIETFLALWAELVLFHARFKENKGAVAWGGKGWDEREWIMRNDILQFSKRIGWNFEFNFTRNEFSLQTDFHYKRIFITNDFGGRLIYFEFSLLVFFPFSFSLDGFPF